MRSCPECSQKLHPRLLGTFICKHELAMMKTCELHELFPAARRVLSEIILATQHDSTDIGGSANVQNTA
jgi:hypothetical protein